MVLAKRRIHGAASLTLLVGLIGAFVQANETVGARLDTPEYKRPDWQGYSVLAGSPLDLTDVLPTQEAGRYGFVRRTPDGGFEYEKRPGVPVRFNGFVNQVVTMGHPWGIPRQQVGEYIRQMRANGYNAIRFGFPLCYDQRGADGKAGWKPNLQDEWDYLVSELKKGGIAIQLIFSPGCNGSGQWGWAESHRLGMFLRRAEMRKLYREMLEAFLSHVNPYTGVAYRDEPVFLSISCWNEQESPFVFTGSGTTAEDRALYKETVAKFRAHRLEKHPDETEAESEALLQDRLVRDMARWYRELYAELGWNGAITYGNLSHALLIARERAEYCDFASDNSYFCHPAFLPTGAEIYDESSIAKRVPHVRALCGVRPFGLPVVNTERNHCWWNSYQYENALVFSAYGALQGIDATFAHEIGVTMAPEEQPVKPFFLATSPVLRACQFLHAMLYARGDVARARHRVVVDVSDRFYAKHVKDALSADQSALALLTGFAVDFPDAGIGRERPKADIRMPACGASGLFTDPWFSTVKDVPADKFTLEGTERLLREKGVLRRENRTDLAKGVYESDTGELLLDSTRLTFSVKTARTEGMAFAKELPQALAHLEVRASSCPATVAVTSLDGRPLAASRRMMLCVITGASNTRTEIVKIAPHPIGQRLVKEGVPPVLYRTGRFDIRLKGLCDRNVEIRPVSFNGAVREPLAVSSQEPNDVSLLLDTVSLPQGPTAFFLVETK